MKALAPFVDRGVLAGAVTLVANKDRVLLHESVGYADAVARRPMQNDSLFWIASTTKPFTGTLAMMLVEQGLLDLDAPLDQYLPDYANPWVISEQADNRMVLTKASRCPTVREAMSHTSGCAFFSKVETTVDLYTLKEAAISYATTPLRFEPGSKYEYGNIGINSVGRIIEILSGMSYGQFLQTKLLDPLGMTETRFVPTPAQTPRLAACHKPVDGKLEVTSITQLKYPLTDPSRLPCPAGGLFSTAADLVKFGQLILRGGEINGKRLISGASVRKMTSKQTGSAKDGAGNPANYGIGWATSNIDPGTGDGPAGPCSHGGACSNQFWIEPQKGLVIVLMLQHAGFAEGVGEAVKEACRNEAFSRFS